MNRFDIARRLRTEDGGVLALVAIGLAALILIVAFVVDVGNWLEHKRHLQVQADASALAGAGSISLPLTSCSDAGIAAVAHNYGGPDANNPTALYNAQIGATPSSKMHILINSVAYFGEAGAADNSGGAPCAASPPNQFCRDASDPTVGGPGIDIKATETDLPWFFGGLVPKINAHARVCLMQETSSGNSLPIAVPNPKPKSAAAIFINEGSGNAVIGTQLLNECTGVTCPALDTWSGDPTDVSIVRQTGVIIAISGLQPATFAPSLAGSPTVASICGQQLTTCFDGTNDPPTVGVDFIRGWSNSPSGQQPSPPQLRDAQLFETPSANCPGNPYFQKSTATCNATIEAKIDSRDATGSGIAGGAMTITVVGAGCGKGCILQKDLATPATPECVAVSANGANGECWTGTIPIKPKAGAQRLTMGWNVSVGTITGQGDCTKGNGCNGTFDSGGFIHQAYTGDNTPSNNISGPLAVVEIAKCSPGCAPPGNSLPLGTQGCAGCGVAVTIGLEGSLKNAVSATDPDASCTFPDGSVHQFACLKVAVTNAASGSTQSVDCDPLANPPLKLEDELALGCAPEYHINLGTPGPWTPCPAKNALNDATHPQPWQCTALFTGNKVPAVGNGINRRIFNGDPNPTTCPAFRFPGHNNWSMYDPTKSGDGFPDGDNRIVGVYLTAYGAFTHTAGTSLTIPVTDFATFYITGYDTSPCASGAPTATAPFDDPIPDKGTLTGHFIKYVDRLNKGGGTTPCDPNSFGACVPVMTK